MIAVRKSVAEIKRENAKALRGLMNLAGKPIPAGDALFALEPAKPAAKRAPVQRVEKGIQDAILAHLRRIGWRAIRHNSGAAVSGVGAARRFIKFNDAPGHSDISGVAPGGRAYFIEVKRPGEKPTPKQQIFLESMSAAGAHTAVLHSLDELFEFVRLVNGGSQPAAGDAGSDPLRVMPPPIRYRVGVESCKTGKG